MCGLTVRALCRQGIVVCLARNCSPIKKQKYKLTKLKAHQNSVQPEPKYSDANSRSLNVQPCLHKTPCYLPLNSCITKSFDISYVISKMRFPVCQNIQAIAYVNHLSKHVVRYKKAFSFPFIMHDFFNFFNLQRH